MATFTGKLAPDWENQDRLNGKFGLKGDEPLANRSTSCRLPASIHEQLDEYFDGKGKSAKSDWLRKVITEAVEREIIHE